VQTTRVRRGYSCCARSGRRVLFAFRKCFVAYTTKQSHECPDCKNAVDNFFSGGALEHTCKTCGEGALEKCAAHIRSSANVSLS
jgi:hypothetical protein